MKPYQQTYRGQKILQPTLKFKKLHPKAKLPTRGTNGAAGYDLYLAEDLYLNDIFWDEETLRTEYAKFGIAVEIPKGYVGILCERSSTHKMGLAQENKLGVIDSDYRGELISPVFISDLPKMREHGFLNDTQLKIQPDEFRVPSGTKIAQLVVVPYYMAEPEWVDELSDTDRGEGGFGSTGT